MPKSIAALPKDPKTGLPVPFFVQWIDGVPDFRVMDGEKLVACVKQQRCWICGERLGMVCAFVIGPMCAVNRISAEPPSHHDCAVFAARVCPFLSKPAMRRNGKDLPEGYAPAPGIPLRRNPGVTLVWVTNGYSIIREGDGVLFSVNEPVQMQWFRESREATLREVMDAVDSGLPILQEAARGRDEVKLLQAMYHRAVSLIESSFAQSAGAI